MSLTINIYYTGTRGSAAAFAREMEQSGIAGRIRAQEGNLRYDYFTPFDDKETVLLIDSWESREALDIHHASPMMAEIAALRENMIFICALSVISPMRTSATRVSSENNTL